MAGRKTFTRANTEELEKMLDLRRQGWSFSAIGLLYNKNHSTIIHHCKKHGVVPLVEVLKHDLGVPLKYKEPPKPPGKYDHLFDEVINHGKLYYVDYLISAGINPRILKDTTEIYESH